MLLIISLPMIVYSQDKLRDSEPWIRVDNDLMYNIVVATDKNQKITKGLLYGMKGDSIYLTLNNKMISFDLKDLITLSIENRRTRNLGTVSGALSGMYLGSLLFLTSKNQSAKYIEYEGSGRVALYELLFVTVGGGIGYLIDRGSKDGQEIFYFDKDKEGVDKEIKNLRKFLTNSSTPGKLHLSISLSQVNTRYSEVKDKIEKNYYNYNYSNIHSFNLLRKLSLTYDLFDNFELGVALSWFGEPLLSYNNYDYYYDTTYVNIRSTISQTYDGLGYYFIINYKPLKNIIPDNLDLIIGAGIGVGKVDYNLKYETITDIYPSEPITKLEESRIDKIMLSSLFCGEVKYFIYPELSISLQADYIYLPENMPAIPTLGLKERNLGNFSFGLGLGANF